MPLDWSRVRFTEHMTEAAAVVAECHVVLDFGPPEQVTYEVKVYEALKGNDGEPYFAVATNAGDPAAFRPVGSGASAEDALQACLLNAGVFHRRRVKQAGD
jgi:hypothetical protein